MHHCMLRYQPAGAEAQEGVITSIPEKQQSHRPLDPSRALPS